VIFLEGLKKCSAGKKDITQRTSFDGKYSTVLPRL